MPEYDLNGLSFSCFMLSRIFLSRKQKQKIRRARYSYKVLALISGWQFSYLMKKSLNLVFLDKFLAYEKRLDQLSLIEIIF